MYTQTPITLFNRRLGTDRREVFFPVWISEASYSEAMGSRRSDGANSQDNLYKLRIPLRASVQDGKTYLPAAAYRLLSDGEAAGCWTLQLGDCLLLGKWEMDGSIDPQELAVLAAGEKIITIAEYADNTHRGTAAVRHWRIGGE